MTANKTDITIVKTFDAPVQSVWKYWSEPKHFKQWWGPADATCIACRMDFRVGGTFLNCLLVQDADGKPVDVWATGTYKVIEPFKKLVFTDSFADKDGNIVPSSHYGAAGIAREVEVAPAYQAGRNNQRSSRRHGSKLARII